MGIGAVGSDPALGVIPVAGSDDQVADATGHQFPVEDEAEGARLVTGDDVPTEGALTLQKLQELVARTFAGWLGWSSVEHGHPHVEIRMGIDGDFEQPLGARRRRLSAIFRLLGGNVGFGV